MRRIIVGLAVAAAACAVVAVVFLTVVARIALQNAAHSSGNEQQTQAQIEAAQRIGQILYSLTLACGPLVAAALVAVVVILALLAFRWELRRAAPPATDR